MEVIVKIARLAEKESWTTCRLTTGILGLGVLLGFATIMLERSPPVAIVFWAPLGIMAFLVLLVTICAGDSEPVVERRGDAGPVPRMPAANPPVPAQPVAVLPVPMPPRPNPPVPNPPVPNSPRSATAVPTPGDATPANPAPAPAAMARPAEPAPSPAPAAAPKPEAAPSPAISGSTILPEEVAIEGRTGTWRYEGETAKPEMLSAPRAGAPDDLKQIKGVGPKLEAMLNSMGFFHFDQIANWTAAEVAWVDENLEGFKGRVSRDSWVDQAKTLAAGEATDFSSRVRDGDVY